MIDKEILTGTQRLLDCYLSPLEFGPWTLENVSISAHDISAYGAPSDARAVRLLIEEPDQGWTVAAEAIYRSRKVWRLRVSSYYDDCGGHGGTGGVKHAYLNWLRSL
ncbi:hypothetical protein [Methylobacterium sp. B4]|uniref:hypothetical protein n=1 Tax=Methylobacterium sp. B4 TaxID=1938755 RepID=UPI000D943681|nr:hypothetical protein [Methylobacterium sp. B4]PXW67128.1 hypothetical protein BY998_101696 [Methylobacterium sp. B4]